MVAGLWIGFAATVVSAGPPNPTPSDGQANTAGGTGALASIVEPGNIDSAGANTAFGFGALESNSSGSSNTALGSDALYYNNGSSNTADGSDALGQNVSGNNNTGDGASALATNVSGSNNTADGSLAMYFNQTGNDNTATGFNALDANQSGNYNTADGDSALYLNFNGWYNTASGYSAMHNNNSGSYDTADGERALYSNTSGGHNTATGGAALYSNQTGSDNTADGTKALYNSTGSSNLGLGFESGQNLTGGSNNVEIANAGLASDSGIIRIGTTNSQTETFIAGISGVHPAGGVADVVVNANGQLGVVLSSKRFKRDIADMGDLSARLLKLRPVTFYYKNDPGNRRQYGLVAEEVARVYPELVSHDQQGRVESVQYSMLTPMLLNELQKQTREIGNQRREREHRAVLIRQLTERDAEQTRQIRSLTAQREQQAELNRRLLAQVARLKGVLEQAIATQAEHLHLASTFNN
jgi:hypothetical protein